MDEKISGLFQDWLSAFEAVCKSHIGRGRDREGAQLAPPTSRRPAGTPRRRHAGAGREAWPALLPE